MIRQLMCDLPEISDSAWTALSDAMTADASAAVRATARSLLRSRQHKRQPRLDEAGAIADEIAAYARSRTPPDLEALDTLGRLTFADVLAELADHDLERRRRAAYRLTWHARAFAKTAPQSLLDDAAGYLLSDTDPLLRSHGVAAVHWLRLARLYPRYANCGSRRLTPGSSTTSTGASLIDLFPGTTS